MELSDRLKTVADMVTKDYIVADVGCDHAYISIYLIENKIAPKVIAMDVNEGPLNIAKNNISMKGYEDKIETRLSDGLEKISVNEVDAIIIAGMGGSLTCKILQESVNKLHSIKELILQPQSELNLVRKLIDKLGFSIIKEKMLIDDGKYYVVIKVVVGEIKNEEKVINDSKVKETQYIYGGYLLEAQDLVLYQYIVEQKEVMTNIKQKLEESNTENAKIRLKEIDEQLNYVNIALSYYK